MGGGMKGHMMRLSIILGALFASGSARADPGHLAGLAGHDHWAAAGAIGVAVAVALWGGLKVRREGPAAGEDAGADEKQEA